MNHPLIHTIKQAFQEAFQTSPAMIVRSPGRINLLGEHTDYNGGYVLPAAINKAVYLAISPREDLECHFVALDLNETFHTSLNSLNKTLEHNWANYLMGVLKEIQQTLGKPLAQGLNLVFSADLPSGGGMSSSAAIENGVGWGVNELFQLGLSRLELVTISQRAENQFVGMNCGIMDMFASMMGTQNHVIRIDCRSLEYHYFPFNAPHLRLVLCDTLVKHALVDSEYNTRRAECEAGVAILQRFDPSVKTLRDVSPAFFNTHKTALKQPILKRCEYVIEEIERVEKACKALENNDFETLGQLMYATHDGLNEKYEVSCTELNFLVEIARHTEGVLGARMMGGGFGGCTINLVQADKVEAFIKKLQPAYERVFKKQMPYYVVTPEQGTQVVK